jgi:hypothetical protein
VWPHGTRHTMPLGAQKDWACAETQSLGNVMECTSAQMVLAEHQLSGLQ